jgi:ATP-dependent exoDNAse (exonuclease V) beta subunit
MQFFGECKSEAKVLFSRGSFNWIKPKSISSHEDSSKIKLVKIKRKYEYTSKHSPSSHGEDNIKPDLLLDDVAIKALDHGQAVHKVFERIEWFDELSLTKLQLFKADYPDAFAEVEKCLEDEIFVKNFIKPIDLVQLWRERAFDVVIDGEMISGVFDRVHLFSDNAEIIDFKSDKIGGAGVKLHISQLQSYRKALAKLTGLDESVIKCKLFFTYSREVLEVE